MKQKQSKPLALCGPNGSPYRVNLEPESLTAFARAFSDKAAVGTRPPHTEQGKNQEKPVTNEICIGATLMLSRSHGFLMVFTLRRLKRAGTDRRRWD